MLIKLKLFDLKFMRWNYLNEIFTFNEARLQANTWKQVAGKGFRHIQYEYDECQ